MKSIPSSIAKALAKVAQADANPSGEPPVGAAKSEGVVQNSPQISFADEKVISKALIQSMNVGFAAVGAKQKGPITEKITNAAFEGNVSERLAANMKLMFEMGPLPTLVRQFEKAVAEVLEGYVSFSSGAGTGQLAADAEATGRDLFPRQFDAMVKAVSGQFVAIAAQAYDNKTTKLLRDCQTAIRHIR